MEEKMYIIDLKDLRNDVERRSYHLDDAFFSGLDGKDIKGGNVDAEVEVRKSGDAFEMTLRCEGVVTVVCDRCLDDMTEDVFTEEVIPVRFGHDNEDSGDAVIVSEEEGLLDIAWLMYELISLSLPMQHVHEDGLCNKEMMMKLAEHSANVHADGESAADPRWNELKKILDNN